MDRQDLIAVVGVGDTDYATDHLLVRAGRPPTDALGYAARALRAALADAALQKRDIDGLITVSLPIERAGEVLGIDARWSCAATDPINAVILASDALRAGRATRIAIVKGLNFRGAGTPFGGPQAMGAEELPHYAWYRPWGFTSQGAFDAVVVQRYMALYGLSEAELGMVAVAQRQWATLNPRAVMRTPLTQDDYLASPFVVAPLRLPDYCMVADGGVAMILAPAELAKPPAVVVAGLGWGEDNGGSSHLRSKLAFNRVQVRLAAGEAYEDAAVDPNDIDVFFTYDNFSGELFYILENCGYAGEGDAAGFVRDRGIGPGGGFPVNTSGGMLSEAYMQGFNAQVEAVRQLRGQAGGRQLTNCRTAQYVSNTIGKASSAIYQRLD